MLSMPTVTHAPMPRAPAARHGKSPLVQGAVTPRLQHLLDVSGYESLHIDPRLEQRFLVFQGKCTADQGFDAHGDQRTSLLPGKVLIEIGICHDLCSASIPVGTHDHDVSRDIEQRSDPSIPDRYRQFHAYKHAIHVPTLSKAVDSFCQLFL